MNVVEFNALKAELDEAIRGVEAARRREDWDMVAAHGLRLSQLSRQLSLDEQDKQKAK